MTDAKLSSPSSRSPSPSGAPSELNCEHTRREEGAREVAHPECPWCGWEAGMAPGARVELRPTYRVDGMQFYRCPDCRKSFVVFTPGGTPEEAL
jgi:hypothetical protein